MVPLYKNIVTCGYTVGTVIYIYLLLLELISYCRYTASRLSILYLLVSFLIW